ncbi:YwqJ-related putative deaminase [Embleya sp. NBC_00896]|uniref:YwqJ-related putative deaminase n=1 Tax=Embleya sp. NBC_00896 TaxID=2975961 RepID=UPI0038637F99|nr:YwqJ-related putative deaminase [Embleya sp. NBC_00896]
MAAGTPTTTLAKERTAESDPETEPVDPEVPEPSRARATRESILPAVAAALFVGKRVRTRAGAKGDTVPTPHPLVRDFLVALPAEARERWRGRCPEVELVSEHLFEAEATRSKRAARRPFTVQEARRSLKGAKLTLRRIREDGDPHHDTYQPPCRSCAPMLDHFGVTPTESG